MKKLMAATLLAAAVLPATSVHAQASTASNVNTNDFPNLKSKTIVNQLKNGTYQYRGIKLLDSYSKSSDKLGKYNTEDIQSSSLGTIAIKTYGKNNDLILSGYNAKKSLSLQDIKVDGLEFNYSTVVKYNDIKNLLGKADDTSLSTESTKIKTDDRLYKEYGNLSISFERPNGYWKVLNIYFLNNTEITPDPSTNNGELDEVKVKTLTSAELKSMKQGTYKFHNVGINDSYENVVKQLGESVSDSIKRTKGKQQLTSMYGDVEALGFFYKKTAVGTNIDKAQIEKMRFNYSDKDMTVAAFEKIVGQASHEVVKSKNEYGDKVKTLYKDYGKHLSIVAEKEKHQWYVIDVSYK